MDQEVFRHKKFAENTIAASPLFDPPAGKSILPAEAYYDQKIFDREMTSIFHVDWIWAGFTHWVSTPGDIFPVEVAGLPLLLVCGSDGVIRVFHNSYRHRGMPLADESSSGNKRIQCAYHCWSFNLDGYFALAPFYQRQRGNAVPEEVQERLHLISVQSYCWAGMIFVNVSASPEKNSSFPELISPLLERWAGIDFSRLSLAAERTFELEVNWKLIVENFLDFYHLPFVHPQVGSVSAATNVDDVILNSKIIGGCYPDGAAGKAQKTVQSLPPLGQLSPDRKASQDIFCLFPNALLFIQDEWFQVIGCNPLSSRKTVEYMAIFVDVSAEGEEYSTARKELAEVLFHVNEQDIPILQGLQAGKSSPAANNLNLVSYWDQVTAIFQTIIAQKMGNLYHSEKEYVKG